jgi:hypothetical protein
MLAMSQRPRLTGHLSVNSNCHLRDIGARLSSQLEMVKRSTDQVDNDRRYRASQSNPSVVSTTEENDERGISLYFLKNCGSSYLFCFIRLLSRPKRNPISIPAASRGSRSSDCISIANRVKSPEGCPRARLTRTLKKSGCVLLLDPNGKGISRYQRNLGLLALIFLVMTARAQTTAHASLLA